MDTAARHARRDALTVSNANACLMARTERAVTTSANQVTPWMRHRHPLTTTHPAKVFEEHRSQRISKGPLLKPLLEHGNGCSGCLSSTAAPASTTATSHAHSTPRAERMALEMVSTSPTPSIRWRTPARS